jgi:hypothetical protein
MNNHTRRIYNNLFNQGLKADDYKNRVCKDIKMALWYMKLTKANKVREFIRVIMGFFYCKNSLSKLKLLVKK